MWARRVVSYVLTALAVVIWILFLFPEQMSELSAMTAHENIVHDIGLWGLLTGVMFSFWVWTFSFGQDAMRYSQASFVGLVASIRLVLGYESEFDTSLYYVMFLMTPILLFATASQVIEAKALGLDSR